jgi:hypothetical protein
MIPLTSARWSELCHAYAEDASDIPRLLAELEALPPEEGPGAALYSALWGALCHQGDIYSATDAAFPHLVAAISRAPERAPGTLFLLVACIEIARARGKRRGPEPPHDLQADYAAALARVPELVGRAGRCVWDDLLCRAALATLAAAKGCHRLAEAVLELEPATVKELLRHKYDDE